MDQVAARSSTDDEAARRFDADAVARTLSGETGAFDPLIEKYQRRAVAVSYRLLGNIEDAMDVCQDAYVRAFRSLSSLDDPQRFGAWLMRIVSNLSLNYRRGRRIHLSLSMDADTGSREGRSADGRIGGGPVKRDPLRSAETEQAISKAVEALPEQQRLALVLFAIERIPQREVAEILECSVEMVKWNVFQARKKLKETLAEYLEE
ncbi:MAG: sigma-70 family RNA polymerase sigma factor [Planctomycetota bacterium]